MTNSTGSESAILRNIPAGEYFRLRDLETAKIYRKAEYCRTEKKYQVHPNDDIWGCGRMLKGTTNVFIGFTY